jgi:TRAP-type C4-dicarboxylate transport system substrate-binding protein
VTDFGAAVQISLTMNLRTRSKLPKEVVKIIDEEAVKWSVASMAQSVKDHQWGLDKLKGAGLKIRTIDPAAQKAWAVQLKDWPNERAQAVKAKKGIDMPKIMRAYMKYSEQGGHKYPHRYVIK